MTEDAHDEHGDGESRKARHNFIREIIEEDLESGKHDHIVTRFPPEPNGYMHIGHTMSVVLNYGIAQDYDGEFHLRFDDTNPLTEEEEYVESIKRDVAWLGADWGEHLYFASDYFDRMYELAEKLIEKGKAYVDSLPPEKIREYRGSWDEPGRESPYRDRSVEENLDLFRRMRDGEFDEGEHVLRAKIDMQADNMVMRDPVMYRIAHEDHYHAGDEWCIYPMYDYAHCLEDAFEGITHSLCTLEFENNREVYNWFVRETEVDHQPRQIEFAGMELGYTVVSKSRLRELVEEGYVEGWDDPRMPTVAGLRRRGVTPQAIWDFVHDVGVARNEKLVEIQQFEHAIRDDLNDRAPRVQCVRDPLRVVIENFPEDETDWIEAPHFPHDVPGDDSRMIPFTREVFIDRDDFREDPPDDYYRLSPGEEVRLRYGYFVTCEEVVRDDDGSIDHLRCSYDPETRGGAAPDGREVRGTIHWVSAAHGLDCELRLYDRMFEVPDPLGRDADFKEFFNDESLVVVEGLVEPSVRHAPPGRRFQFERDGYYMVEPEDSTPDDLVFNRVVPLRDTWEDEETERRKREARRRAREKAERKERKKEEAERAREERRAVLFGELEASEATYYSATERDTYRAEHPTLDQKPRRYHQEIGLDLDDADVMSGSVELSNRFEGIASRAEQVTAADVAGWLRNELVPRVEETVGTRAFDEAFEELFETLDVEELARLLDIRASGRITDDAAEDVLDQMLETGGSAESIVEEQGLEAITDEETIREIVDEVFAENDDQLDAYAGGKTKLFGYFVGQVMRATDGRADPQVVRDVLQRELPDPDETS